MSLTIEDIKDAGYPLTSLKDESAVALAEQDVKIAYFPNSETFEDEKVIGLLIALTYSLLIRRRIIATRFGSVAKVSQYTIAADEYQLTREIRGYCTARLERYIATNKFKFIDILNIYDVTFFSQ